MIAALFSAAFLVLGAMIASSTGSILDRGRRLLEPGIDLDRTDQLSALSADFDPMAPFQQAVKGAKRSAVACFSVAMGELAISAFPTDSSHAVACSLAAAGILVVLAHYTRTATANHLWLQHYSELQRIRDGRSAP